MTVGSNNMILALTEKKINECLSKHVVLKTFYCIVLTLFFILYTQEVWAKNTEKKKVMLDIKCHVLLADSTEDISFWFTSKKEFKTLMTTLAGKTTFVLDKKNEVKIDKVYECVLVDDKFSTAKARLLDSNTAY